MHKFQLSNQCKNRGVKESVQTNMMISKQTKQTSEDMVARHEEARLAREKFQFQIIDVDSLPESISIVEDLLGNERAQVDLIEMVGASQSQPCGPIPTGLGENMECGTKG